MTTLGQAQEPLTPLRGPPTLTPDPPTSLADLVRMPTLRSPDLFHESVQALQACSGGWSACWLHLAGDLGRRRLLGGADLQPHLVDQGDHLFPRARRLLLHRRAQLVLGFGRIAVSEKEAPNTLANPV